MDVVESALNRKGQHTKHSKCGKQPFRRLALCKELTVPVAARCHVTQTSHSHRLTSPPGNEQDGAPGSKGCNLHNSLEQ